MLNGQDESVTYHFFLSKIWRLKNGQNGCNTLGIQFFATTTYKYGAGFSK
jgi:hypothetical protein